MIRYRSWSALFLLASLVLGATLWLQVTQSTAPDARAGAGSPPMRSAPASDTKSPTQLRALAAYSAIAERPLFTPTRRPVESVAPSATSQPRKSLAKFVLSGVIIVSADEKTALLREAASSTVQRLSEGQEIAGWRIEKILEDRVILVSGDETAEIELWSDMRPAPPPGANQSPQRPTPSPRPRGLRLPAPAQTK